MSKGTPAQKNVRVILIWANVAVGCIAVLGLLFAGALTAYGKLYDGKIFPGVRVLGVRLDGLTPSEARSAVDTAVDQALGQGLRFRFRGRDIRLDAASAPTNPEASHDLIRYDVDTAMERAAAWGHTGGWVQRSLDALRLLTLPKEVGADVTVDRETIRGELRAAVEKDLSPAQNASFDVNLKTTPPAVSVNPEKEGKELAIDPALDLLTIQAFDLSFAPIELEERTIAPTLLMHHLTPLVPAVSEMLARPQLHFIYDGKTVAIPTSTLAGWIVATGTRDDAHVAIDAETFTADLLKLFPSIEVEKRNGNLVVKDGKIVSFTAGVSGRKLDADATLSDVEKNWPPTSTFALVVRTVESTLEGDDPERLGIKEIIGVGHSNFSGSPSNRRKNIALGVERVNGTIIQPGKEFSLLTVLGPVDGAHGWLPELVIKGNETKPEYGGGLCQIGTTSFRGALSSGLPIVERQNHSYRVRYYEPAGTDATIYEPRPDFRFLNDTATPVLINAYVTGDDITFEFWGTKDGRKAEFDGQTKVTNVDDLRPRVYNVASPPAMKLVETLDLPPGKKKCTESAHAGADADFTYTVTYPSGEVKNEVFRSHYRPWQAVCLVGVEKLSEAPSDTPATPVTP